MEEDRRVFPIVVLLQLTYHQCDKKEEFLTSTGSVTVWTFESDELLRENGVS